MPKKSIPKEFLLTLFHTMATFSNWEKRPFKNREGKRVNAGYKHFLLFPLFLTCHKINCAILTKIKLLTAISENAFKLDLHTAKIFPLEASSVYSS